MLKAILNFPVEAKFIEDLVEDTQDLQLMFPKAELPFNERQWLAKLAPTSDSLSFKVTRENVLVGHFAFLRISNALQETTLGFVYLSPILRKTGTARKLMELSEQTAVELLNIKTMLLNVRPSNLPAYSLYLKAGYIEYERTEDLVRMKKLLQ